MTRDRRERHQELQALQQLIEEPVEKAVEANPAKPTAEKDALLLYEVGQASRPNATQLAIRLKTSWYLQHCADNVPQHHPPPPHNAE